MRFSVELLLDQETIPKDKNRIILSLLKHNFSSYDEEYYSEIYEEGKNKTKDFTFSLYMGGCKFLREEIIIPEKKLILNLSTYSAEEGIIFYNSFLRNKGLKYPIKNNTMNINRINLVKEKTICADEVIYKAMSPIVARSHSGDNKKTWYYSLNDKKGEEVFASNLKYQLRDAFGEDRILDFEELEIEVLHNKEVKVKNYGIEVLGNVCRLKIKGKPYILDYLYKAGIGSQKSSGFGMVDLV